MCPRLLCVCFRGFVRFGARHWVAICIVNVGGAQLRAGRRMRGLLTAERMSAGVRIEIGCGYRGPGSLCLSPAFNR
jgi:hypothetical protein